MIRIMVVEDDKKMNEGIRLALKQEGYIFIPCFTIGEARTALREQKTDLILLDVNLPDGNGIDLVREIRGEYSMPIILLTVNDTELDIVMGLEAGADDYITKPFSLMVLRARVAVQLRDRDDRREHFIQGGLDLDFENMRFFRDGRPLELSITEQKLLRILCENRGATVKRSHLIDSVWSGETEFVDEHALTVAMKRLRGKLEDGRKKEGYIKTVYGVGYAWVMQS